MSQPIRVAQILGDMTGYGVERYVMKYYRYMDRSKVQFDLVAHEGSTVIPYEEVERLGGRVFLVPAYHRLGEYMTALEGLFRENRYPIVHAQIGTMSVFPLCAAKRAGVPFRVVHNHSAAALSEGKKSLLKYALRPFAKVYATHYAACSRHAAEWLFGRRTVERGQAMIFDPVSELDEYRYDPAVRAQVRQELGLEGRFVVGHVGRFCDQKNHLFLVDIFRAIHERRPEARLLLAGDGDTRAAVEEKLERLGLRDDALFLGLREDVGRLYQAMDVFLLPSLYEGLPVVAVEAQAAGLKAVVSTGVTEEAKVRDDMAFLELSAGAERWAEEALRADPAGRAYEGDYSAFDVTVQAKLLEQFYCGLVQADGRIVPEKDVSRS